MRLSSPNVESLTSHDGKSSLSFHGVEMHPDVGGGHYSFELAWPSAKGGKITGRAIVGSVTNMYAYDYYLKQGIDIVNLSMPWQEADKYRE